MEDEWTVRIEEIENGQQNMQEKMSQVMKMMTDLIKGNGIIEDPKSQKRLASRKMTTARRIIHVFSDPHLTPKYPFWWATTKPRTEFRGRAYQSIHYAKFGRPL